MPNLAYALLTKHEFCYLYAVLKPQIILEIVPKIANFQKHFPKSDFWETDYTTKMGILTAYRSIHS